MKSVQKVQTKSELIALLKLNEVQIKQFGVSKLDLFGSFVRDEAKEDSDIDLYVDFFSEKKNYNNFIDLIYFIEDATGRDVTVVTPQSLSPFIGPHILKSAENVI